MKQKTSRKSYKIREQDTKTRREQRKNKTSGKTIRTKKKMTRKKEKKETEEAKISKNFECNDRKCPFHGELKVRGRHFKGTVKKIMQKRVVIEFERLIYYKKYERYAKEKTKLHAYLPDCMKDSVKVGDRVKIGECRPLSKIIHFVILEKIK